MTFIARYDDVCHSEKCPDDQLIAAGEECAYDAHDRIIHAGCVATTFEVPEDTAEPVGSPRARRQARPYARNQACSDCNLVHAGECW